MHSHEHLLVLNCLVRQTAVLLLFICVIQELLCRHIYQMLWHKMDFSLT